MELLVLLALPLSRSQRGGGMAELLGMRSESCLLQVLPTLSPPECGTPGTTHKGPPISHHKPNAWILAVFTIVVAASSLIP